MPLSRNHATQAREARLRPFDALRNSSIPLGPQACDDVISFFDSHANREPFQVGRAGVELNLGYILPPCCESSFETIQGRIGKIGIAPIFSLCLWEGIRQVKESSNVTKLLDLKSRFAKTSGKLSGVEKDAISDLFKGIAFNLPQGKGGKASRWKFRIPESVKDSSQAMAGDFGVPESHCAVLSVMQTLMHQSDDVVIPDHKETMRIALDEFFAAVTCKAKIVGAVMEKFGLL